MNLNEKEKELLLNHYLNELFALVDDEVQGYDGGKRGMEVVFGEAHKITERALTLLTEPSLEVREPVNAKEFYGRTARANPTTETFVIKRPGGKKLKAAILHVTRYLRSTPMTCSELYELIKDNELEEVNYGDSTLYNALNVLVKDNILGTYQDKNPNGGGWVTFFFKAEKEEVSENSEL